MEVSLGDTIGIGTAGDTHRQPKHTGRPQRQRKQSFENICSRYCNSFAIFSTPLTCTCKLGRIIQGLK